MCIKICVHHVLHVTAAAISLHSLPFNFSQYLNNTPLEKELKLKKIQS